MKTKLPKTLKEEFRDLHTAIEEFKAELWKIFGPCIIYILDGLANILKKVSR